MAGAGLAVYGLRPDKALAWYQSQPTPLWRTAFRGVGPGGIPVAAPDPFPAPTTGVAPNGAKGMSFLNNAVLNPGAAPNQAEYYYPMNQSARMLWYHDHAWGITRLNAYAGIATALLIRDAFEVDLKNQGLPEFIE